MDGGDEDEHDEGAHQVGLEDLVPHLGVLQGERVGWGRGLGEREEEGDDVREGGGEKRFQADGEERTPQTHTEAPTQRHATV